MTEDEQTKSAFTSLKDISPQNRPLAAGPNDIAVGFDELGGTIYKSATTGEQYTLYPETKTKQERPIVAAAKAVGEYLSDPSLPSLEQTSEFAKETVKGAYEPFRKIAQGDNPTYGDLMQVLPAGTVGNFKSKLFSKEVVPEPISEPTLKFNDLLYDENDFESLDADFTPINKASPVEEPEAQPDFLLGQKQTPETLLKSIKDYVKADAEDYDQFTWVGAAARDKQKILNHYKDKELLKLVEDLPHYEDMAYGPYVENVIKPAAKYLGVDKSNFMSLLSDLEIAFPPKPNPALENIAEKPLPHRAPIGERAAKGAPARPSDPKAEALGFKDTVYHTSVSPDEFTEFDLNRGFVGQSRAAQDLLGVHVGTARAAAERNLQAVRGSGTPQGFTMELRARTDKPVTKEGLAKMFGYDVKTIFSPGDKPLTEGDIGEAISIYEDIMFKDRKRPQDSREIAAVSLRRELAKEGFTHIPYINDVEDAGSTSLIMLIDRPKDSPAVLRHVRAKFDPNKIASPDLRFAEGGMVEERQMERLMREGGMADDGMTHEPVTGNEIPPGSMASEVRDDIPSQLSEGEYVIPADVVRFFGVRFFEDLRNQAKQGLAEMDAQGRIGGSAVDSNGVPMEAQDDELTPEEQQMLMEALGGASKGMAAGGDVAGFDRTQFQLNGNNTGGIQARKYINPTTKEERTVQFLNGMPLGIIPEGFVPWTKELAEQVTTPEGAVGTAPVKVERDAGIGADKAQENKGDSYADWAGKNYDAISNDPFGFGMSALGNLGKKDDSKGILGGLLGGVLGGTALGTLGGLIGDAKTLDAISDAQVALSKLDPTSDQAKTLEAAINSATDSLNTGALEKLANLGVVANGNQKNAALDKYAETMAGGGGGSSSSGAPSIGSPGKTYGGSISVSNNSGGGGLSYGNTPGGNRGNLSAGIDVGGGGGGLSFGGAGNTGAAPSPSTGGSVGGSASGTASIDFGGSKDKDKDKDGYGGYGGAAEPGAVGPMAKGGLVTKPKKAPAKKRKGLAS